jgi:Cd2+/Zn2+-exporting ATPase
MEQKLKSEKARAETETLVYDVQELDCADCATQFEAAVAKLSGVVSARVNFATAILTIKTEETEVASKRSVHQEVLKAGARFGHPVELRGELGTEPVQSKAGGTSDLDDLVYDVKGLDCADCAAHFEEAVEAMPAVDEVSLNFGAAILTVSPVSDADTDRQALQAQLVDTAEAMGLSLSQRGRGVKRGQGQERERSWVRRVLDRPRDRLTVIAGLFIVSAFVLRFFQVPSWLSKALYAAGIVSGGYYVARAGWYGLRATRSLDMNALMALAAVGAMIIGEWAEGAMVIFLFSVGNTLEGYTMNRARDAIRKLMNLAPKVALRINDGQRVEVPVTDLEVGDRILVRADERIPMDGVVQEGRSAVNQAPVTGESIPVEKSVGDQVYAGTVNGGGSLTVEVTHLAEDNTIARIIRMVEEAQASKAPSQDFVDRFARVYTPFVIGAAFLVATVPPLIGLGTWGVWFYRALVLLVISCPCALVISTPVSIVSAIARAARMGVLIKGGSYLEALGGLRVIAFDKTGTLTKGEVKVVQGVCSLHPQDEKGCPDYLELLAQAAAVEQHSQHPLARAVVEEAQRAGVASPAWVAEKVQAEPGRGIIGAVNGRRIAIGRHDYVHEHRGAGMPDAFCELAEREAQAGHTTMVVADLDTDRRGLLSVSDQVREEASTMLAELKQEGIEKTVMLTGDNQATGELIGEQVGVDEVYAELSPGAKVEAVRDLLERHGHVGMIGDGVNDAPALAQATVGIAMGAVGTDVALETADVALMADDLAKVAPTIRLGRRTLAIIKQNIAISLLIKVLFLALAVSGLATLWMAVFADVGTSMLVILNGMRLLRGRD